ncbi:MAG: hypothetical protein A2086_06580 [Spirochaetes bacterium GWD1_27_9]|nr:MAG: hypothetical protein A2Z98_15730 [Spirochaetes bacterium GWB1_27_13]OHD26365.1 MAG: hypothetical protein A2Y34_05715 [Spirochaetes bacterium GWC1_27_15]OHD41305.1 MAG: hypothetical protein A2086_06580 [Spirochaetes bacterium GWD1_27_9]
MKKIAILFLLLLSNLLYSQEDEDLIEKKIYNFLTISKYTRDVGIGLLTPAAIFSLASIPIFAYYNFQEDFIPDDSGIFDYNHNDILALGISSLSCGMFFNISIATLFIFSKIYEDKANLLLNQIPLEKRQNIDKNIPSYLKPWNLNKKLAITGMLLLIYGGISITGGIVELIAFNMIKINRLNITNRFNYRETESHINESSGTRQNMVSISVLLSIGSAMELAGIIFFIAYSLEKQKNLMYNKYNLTKYSPILGVNPNNALLGLKISF